MTTRRDFLASATALAANSLVKPSALGAMSRPSNFDNRPNILIFMPDQTQGKAVLPGYPCLTPNVDRFAAQGLLFPNSFCPSPHCCPSRASFQTGLYPSEHGVFNNVDTDTAIHANPYPGTKYFPEYLRRAGYQLDYSGKWHVGRDVTPSDAGWTNSNSAHSENPQHGTHSSGYVPGRHLKNSAWTKARGELNQVGSRQPGEVFRPGWGNVELYKTLPSPNSNTLKAVESQYRPVLAGTEKMKRLASSGHPWALMVSNDGSHDLYDVPKHFVDMYDPKSIELPTSLADVRRDLLQRMWKFAQAHKDQIFDPYITVAMAPYGPGVEL